MSCTSLSSDGIRSKVMNLVAGLVPLDFLATMMLSLMLVFWLMLVCPGWWQVSTVWIWKRCERIRLFSSAEGAHSAAVGLIMVRTAPASFKHLSAKVVNSGSRAFLSTKSCSAVSL